MKDKSNIVLVGMPGAGKSTVGVLLAKETSRDFIDTDILIQIREGRTLQEIVDSDGYIQLRHIEEHELLSVDVHNHVIATGGSAVYSDISMQHLKQDGIIVFLDVSLPVLESRVHDYSQRGLARRQDQSFEDLFEERYKLYCKYADITVDCNKLNQDEACERIISAIDSQ